MFQQRRKVITRAQCKGYQQRAAASQCPSCGCRAAVYNSQCRFCKILVSLVPGAVQV